MVGTTKTWFALSALAVSAQFNPALAAAPAAGAAPAIPGDRDTQFGAADAVDKQNNAFKVSPQDMNYDQHKIDDDEKFSAPRKAPNDKQAPPPGDAEPEHNIAPPSPEGDSLASSGSKGSKILDDYDPNRLGVSADEAKSGKDAKDTKNSGKSSKNDASKDTKNDAKAKGDAVQNKQSNENYAGSRKKTSKAVYLEPKKSIPWGPAAGAGIGAGAGAGNAVATATAAAAFKPSQAIPSVPTNAGSSAESGYSVPAILPSSAALAERAYLSSGPAAHASAAAVGSQSIDSPPLFSSAAAAPASRIVVSTTTSLPALLASATETSSYANAAPVAKDRQKEAQNLQEAADLSDKAKSNGAKEKSNSAKEKQAVEENIIASEHSFGKLLGAALMIVTSEIGDKTFFIAALMAMRHPHLFVFSSSYSAMVIMTILSMVLGLILPSLLSKRVTTLLAALLFLVFGYRLLKEGWYTDPSLAATDELEDVEQDIEMHESTRASEKAEGGGIPRSQDTGTTIKQYVSGLSNLAALVLSPVWIQIFAMTFLGEWGDRSQIATVAMGAGSGWKEVLVGCLIGHFITTVIAVLGGKILAQHLSLRTITLSGAACFLLFAIIYFNDWLHQ